MADIESQLESNYREEEDYIINYPEVIDNAKADDILKAWNKDILGRGEYENLEISEASNSIKTFNLPESHTNALRRLRYGVVISDIISKDESLVVEDINETIRQRVEYGGHINQDTQEITLKYKGEKGVIEEYEFLKDKINYHTHPSLINKWGFSPPSEMDLKTTVTESLKLNERIVSLVGAAEGIYVYYLTKELFDFFKTDDGSSKISSIDEDYFQKLKLLLGYVRNGAIGPRRIPDRRHNRRGRGETSDSNPSPLKRTAIEDDSSIRRSLFGGAVTAPLSPPRAIRHVGVTLIDREITIEKFLETIRNMGFFIERYEYGEDLVISIPNDVVTPSVMPMVTSIGGSKIYKINFTKL